MSIDKYLGEKYSDDNYIRLCSLLLKDIIKKEENLEVQSQFKEYINACNWIADFKDTENKKIAILSVSINDYSNARTIQRNYISKLLSNGELMSYDGALVAFHDSARGNWKLALVVIDFDITEKGIKISFKPAKRFSFLVGIGEPSKTYMDQLKPLANSDNPPLFTDLKEAFSISRVTKDFYTDYSNCYYKLVEYLVNCTEFKKEASNLNYEHVEDFAVTFTKKTLGQIVFLHFLQKKGWLGVPIDKEWGDGDKHYIFNTILNEKYCNYYNDVLEPLFYEALNKKRIGDVYENSKIPFLNGGLFSPIEQYNWKNTNFNIPNEFWFNSKETGFLDLLNQYNFTIDESDPSEQDIAVDPEMLGKIFESLLDEKERHSKGAHYTPREIVHFMCIEALAYDISKNLNIEYKLIKNYILCGNSLDNLSDIKNKAKIIDEHIKNIKIVDPAVGSGAFLVGMLNEIVKLRANLSELLDEKFDVFKCKEEAIQNSLYGVDIENDAIEIAKLRLWLSLIVDQSVDKLSSPKPLPNLSFKLRVGNSLVDVYQGVKLWDERLFEKKRKVSMNKNSLYSLFGHDLFDVMDPDSIVEKLYESKKLYFTVTEEREKNELYEKINDLQMELIKHTLFKNGRYDLFNEVKKMKNDRTKPFFLWKLEFESVFKNGGFDIVIANPPYVQLQENGGRLAKELEQQGFSTFTRQGDIYCLFYEQAVNLLKDNGIFSFITSNKWMRAGYGELLRNFLSEHSNPLLLVNFGGVKIFESATVDVNVLIASKGKNEGNTKTVLIDEKCTEDLSVYIEQFNNLQKFNSGIWSIYTDLEINIKNKIEMNSIILSKLNIAIKRGILTGLNEAFIINETQYKILIKKDIKNAEVIRPLIRGRDVKRFHVDFPQLYLINIHNGNPQKNLSPIDINEYPYIKEHLDKYINELIKRKDKGYTPYNLRSCSYMEDFFKPKIIYPETTQNANFYLDIDDNYFLDKTCFMMLTNYPYYICSLLASNLYEFAYKH